ncbi:MAG: DUF4376 domain-containing protein [Alphaproteobacteria bacterium]|nr:DUF4376 domain-containing protein [Alphaproteobacteria bacterium]MCW5743814.1 DUF4376 domain-containing protein [Alphaproteobacteria bacterium]
MSAPILFHVDRFGAFNGATSTARRSPADEGEVWLIPEGATTKAPPVPQTGKVAVLHTGTWSVVDDHRGLTVYDKATGAARVIEAPGSIGEDETPEGPPTPLHRWSGDGWALPLDDAKALRLAEVRAELTRRNAQGFTYGGVVYQLDEASQARITALVTKATMVLLAVPGATWAEDFVFIAHDNSGVPFTAAGYVAFANAASEVVIARRLRARALKDRVLAASDTDVLAAIDVTRGWD